ncbi:hypothetical protein M5K25_023610 [Dendrobium thyrsiflorum]|uniref:Uncharacterized protein n=1 Tax=Dendrobium thyrsiflorum TaxID=117978 RepID=A0ABD0U8S6_DENTH
MVAMGLSFEILLWLRRIGGRIFSSVVIANCSRSSNVLRIMAEAWEARDVCWSAKFSMISLASTVRRKVGKSLRRMPFISPGNQSTLVSRNPSLIFPTSVKATVHEVTIVVVSEVAAGAGCPEENLRNAELTSSVEGEGHGSIGYDAGDRWLAVVVVFFIEFCKETAKVGETVLGCGIANSWSVLCGVFFGERKTVGDEFDIFELGKVI